MVLGHRRADVTRRLGPFVVRAQAPEAGRG